jgi:hypothetical protein
MGGLRKLRRRGLGTQYKVEPLRSGESFPGKKMSEVLLDFARPLLDEYGDDDFQSIIGFSAACWDISFMPEEKRQKELESLLDLMEINNPADRQQVENQARMLLERKKSLFADDKRMVKNYHIVDEGGYNRLFVLSSPLETQ